MVRRHRQKAAQGCRELCVDTGCRLGCVVAEIREQRRVGPQRLAVPAPEDAERPARQRFVRVPFAHAMVDQAVGRIVLLQPPEQHFRGAPLRRAVRLERPFRTLEIIDRDEGRLAAHGEAYVAVRQRRIQLLAECADCPPLLVAIRLGDAWILEDARDGVAVFERNLASVGAAFDRRRVQVMRRAGERDMALCGEQA